MLPSLLLRTIQLFLIKILKQKIMKKTVLIFALLFCSLFTKTHAQFYEPDAETLQLLNSADYIFEGMVLDDKSYYNDDKTKIFTTSKVTITKVYKGDLKEGTVELISEGGRIGLDERIERGVISPGYKESAIFLCKKSAFKSASKETFDNTIKLDLLNKYANCLLYSESTQPKFELFGLNEIYFKTKQDFENFLLKVKGVKIPTTATARRSQEKRPSFEEFMKEQNQRAAIAKNNAKKKGKKKRTAAATNDLTITLANAIITQTGAIRFFEFDVMASANNSNTYFSNAIVRLDFNTSAFGSNIATTPGALLLTNGSDFPISQYVSNQYDVNASRINIALSDKGGAATTWSRTRLPTTPIVLLHAKIKVVGCGAILGITSFAETTFTPWFSSYTTTAGANYATSLSYTNTYYTNTLTNTIASTSMCSSGFSFSPAKIHSGNNQVLTITGSGFGTARGNVLFQNANLGYSEDINNFLNGLDNNYIKDWTDTKIEVYVPSKVTEGARIVGEYGGAASGLFKVVKPNGEEKISNTTLDIEYAITNLGSGIVGDPFGKYHLARVNCVNGFVFTLHTSFNNNLAAVTTVEQALKDWSDKLNIKLELEKNAQKQVVYESNFNAVNKNVIILDPTYLNYGEASVAPVGIETYVATKLYYRTNADIKFNANKPWHFIHTGDLPAGKSDFYHAITHEIGHVLGLDHAVNAANGTKDVMYYTAIRNQTQIIPAAQRINLNTFGARAVNGAIAKIAIDKATIWTTPDIATLGTESPAIPTIKASGPVSFCMGGSVTLTASVAANYLWSNGATTNSIVVSNSGTYSVTTTSAGCSTTSLPVTVIVNENPVITIQPLALTTCVAETVSLTLTAAGTGLKYQWQSSSNGVNYTNIANSTTFSGALTSTLVLTKPSISFNNWSYRCIVANANACATTSSAVKHTMTVVALAPFNSVYKTTPAFALTGGSPSGGTYSGTGVSNGVFNPASLAPGIYTVTYTKNTCSPASASQKITVVACCALAITTNNLSSTTFKLSTVAAANVSIDFTALGTFTTGNKFIAQLSNAAGSFASPVNIGSITGLSSGKISAIIPNTTLAGSGYKIRVVSTTPVVIGSTNESVINISKATQKTSATDKIENQNEDSILYPNPATDKVNVSLPASSFDNNGYIDIVISGVDGKIVKKIKSQFLTTSIDVSDFTNGIYILKMGAKNKEILKKLVVQHN